MINGKRIIALAAAAAGLLFTVLPAGAQATGTTTAQSGFNVENLLMELSNFLPEEYASFGGRGFFVGGPNGAPGGAAPGGAAATTQGSGQQGGTTGQAAPSGQANQRPQGFDIPQFKRDTKLMLTAKQVDALLPVLQDLQKTPYPTPSQAKKVTTTVDATLTKQQKDAYDKYVKERDKAMEELRKQFASRAQGSGTQGAQGGATGGGVVTRDNAGDGTGTGQRTQGQRQQVDPAELRKQMLEGFIKNLQEYRKGLK
jgi:hypothetical protein